MQSLYDLIENLVEEKDELRRRGMIIKYDARRGEPVAKSEFERIVAREKQVDAQINEIEKEYVIDIDEMGEIISKYTGEHYIPKIFRKIYMENGEAYYTNVFVGCYVNKNSQYYSSKEYSISLLDDEFNKLLNEINITKTIPFSSSNILSYKPLFPAEAFRGTNFIKMYTRGYHHSYDFIREFINKIEPMLKTELENTNIITNDINFNRGL